MTEYYLPDIPRLYTALAEWMACLIFILPFKKRFSPAVTGCLVAGAFGIQSVFLISTGGVRLIFWIPCMIFAVFLMVAFVFCCCEIRLTDAAYFGMIAFVAAEFMASAGWQILCYTGKEAWMSWWQQGMAILLIYGVIAVILYKILHIHMPKDGQMEITRREYFSGLLISIAVFAVSNMSYVNVNTPFTGRYSFEIGNIRTIVDVAGIAILYAHLAPAAPSALPSTTSCSALRRIWVQVPFTPAWPPSTLSADLRSCNLLSFLFPQKRVAAHCSVQRPSFCFDGSPSQSR